MGTVGPWIQRDMWYKGTWDTIDIVICIFTSGIDRVYTVYYKYNKWNFKTFAIINYKLIKEIVLKINLMLWHNISHITGFKIIIN